MRTTRDRPQRTALRVPSTLVGPEVDFNADGPTVCRAVRRSGTRRPSPPECCTVCSASTLSVILAAEFHTELSARCVDIAVVSTWV